MPIKTRIKLFDVRVLRHSGCTLQYKLQNKQLSLYKSRFLYYSNYLSYQMLIITSLSHSLGKSLRQERNNLQMT